MAPNGLRSLEERAPILRTCLLCEESRSITPSSQAHRQAHLTGQIAFVCEECEARVRAEVEQLATVILNQGQPHSV